jgi:hypothetical protein
MALAALVASSTSALAETCFLRSKALKTDQVALARIACLKNAELDLQFFKSSKAKLELTLDGKPTRTTVELRGGRSTDSGYFYDFALEDSYSGGLCGETWRARSTGKLFVLKDGSAATLVAIEADVRHSEDDCHASTDLVQSFEYSLQD